MRYNKNKMNKYAPTFLKNLVDQNMITEKFILGWYDKEVRLDKESYTRDKNAEKHFRELVEKYIEWLR